MATGSQANIIWGLETTLGTLATNVNKAFGPGQELTPLSFDRQQKSLKSIGTRNITGLVPGMFKGGFSVKFALVQPWVFRLMQGGYAASGAGPYTYTFTEASVLPSFSVLNYITNTEGGSNTLQTFLGCVVGNWTVDVGNSNDPIQITLDVVYANQTEATTALTQAVEVDTLTITAACTSSASCTVTLDNVPYPVSLTSGLTTSQVAAAIAAANFPGWAVTVAGAVVTFTSIIPALRVAPAYSAGTTGATGTMVRTTSGTGVPMPNESPLIFGNATWQKNGTAIAKTDSITIKCNQNATMKAYLGSTIPTLALFGTLEYDIKALNYYQTVSQYKNDFYGGTSPTGPTNQAPNSNTYSLVIATQGNQPPAAETITVAITGGYPCKIGQDEKAGEEIMEDVEIIGTSVTITVATPEAVVTW